MSLLPITCISSGVHLYCYATATVGCYIVFRLSVRQSQEVVTIKCFREFHLPVFTVWDKGELIRFWNWRWKITSRPNCSKMAEAYTLTARHWVLPRFFVCIQASGTMYHWPGLGKDFREASVINLYFGSFLTSRIYTGRLLGDMMVGDVCDVMFAVVHCIFRFEM